METCINYTDKEKAWVSSDERRWITKIRKLAEQKPDDVTIIRQPEENDGCIYATLPVCWVEIRAKTRRELSDEERLVLADRLAKMRAKIPARMGGEDDDED